MRAFAWFLGLLLAALAVMAFASYPAWLLLHPHFDFAFHRIASRLAILAAALGLALIARRLRLADRASFGYGLPLRLFVREWLRGLALGVALMALIVVLMGLLGLRVWRTDLGLAAAASLVLPGLLRGMGVALIEESFLRGAMFTGIARESGDLAAVLLTSLMYAATHFIGRFHIAPQDVTPGSGIELLAGTLAAFAAPARIADAFACYFAVGVVLAMVRALTGNIAACIGLHAGWVWVIALASDTSRVNSASPLAFLVSRWDGMVGWLVCAWALAAATVLWRAYLTRGPHPA